MLRLFLAVAFVVVSRGVAVHTASEEPVDRAGFGSCMSVVAVVAGDVAFFVVVVVVDVVAAAADDKCNVVVGEFDMWKSYYWMAAALADYCCLQAC